MNLKYRFFFQNLHDIIFKNILKTIVLKLLQYASFLDFCILSNDFGATYKTFYGLSLTQINELSLSGASLQ